MTPRLAEEPRQEVALLDRAVLAPVQRHDLVAVRHRAVPRAVQRNDRRALVARGPRRRAQEDDAERGVVRAETVRGRLRRREQRLVPGAQVGVEHVEAVHVRPAVEGAALDAVEFVRREVVAKQVAAVLGGVERAVPRRPVEADAVAQAGRVDLALRAVGREAHHRGATRVLFLADVAGRALREVEPAVRAEADGARDVRAVAGEAGDDVLVRGRVACRVCSSKRHATDGGLLRRRTASRRESRVRAARRGPASRTRRPSGRPSPSRSRSSSRTSPARVRATTRSPVPVNRSQRAEGMSPAYRPTSNPGAGCRRFAMTSSPGVAIPRPVSGGEQRPGVADLQGAQPRVREGAAYCEHEHRCERDDRTHQDLRHGTGAAARSTDGNCGLRRRGAPAVHPSSAADAASFRRVSSWQPARVASSGANSSVWP